MFSIFFTWVTNDRPKFFLMKQGATNVLLLKYRHYYGDSYQYMCVDLTRLLAYHMPILFIIVVGLVLEDMSLAQEGYIESSAIIALVYLRALLTFLAVDIVFNGLFFKRRILVTETTINHSRRICRACLYAVEGSLGSIFVDKSDPENAAKALIHALRKRNILYRFARFDVINMTAYHLNADTVYSGQ